MGKGVKVLLNISSCLYQKLNEQLYKRNRLELDFHAI